ncbi:MAG: RMD1 family protein [Candidatus Eisenbacteria bacterium]|nr:RMD1 family protein [Candidatus Eisenbacteria bacterium]
MPNRISVLSDYFDGPLNVRVFRAQYPHYRVLASDPLLIEPEHGSLIVLTKFGGLVYWNCSEALIRQIREEVRRLPGIRELCEEVSDRIEVEVGPRTEVQFERIALREINTDTVRIVSRALAQSVALELFEIRLNDALAKAEPVVARLRDSGALSLNEREVVQSVGFALATRSNVLANLTLFDDPPEAWESASIARLVAQLWDYFDLDERLDAINQKVGFLSDLNATLLGLQNNRKSRRLEWIIIVLIFLEIVFFVWLELGRRL